MASKKSHEGEEPVGWVTVKGVHFPKWADGSIGWDSGTEKKDFKTMKKEADKPGTGYSRTPVEKERNANPTDKSDLRHEMFAIGENLPNEGEFKFMSMSEKVNANGSMSFTGTNIHKKDVPELVKRLQQSGYEVEIKKDFYIPSSYSSKGGQYGRVDIKMKKTPKADTPKPVSKNARYDTSRATNQSRKEWLKRKEQRLGDKALWDKGALGDLQDVRSRLDEHSKFEAGKIDMRKRLDTLKTKEKSIKKSMPDYNPNKRQMLWDLKIRIAEIEKLLS